jgi:hypothetical protein
MKNLKKSTQLLTLVLIFITTIVFTGCSTKKEATAQDSKETTATEANSDVTTEKATNKTTEAAGPTTAPTSNTDTAATKKETPSASFIAPDEDMVEITLPAVYMEGTTQEELNQKFDPYAIATLNEDGSVMLSLPKDVHAELVEEVGIELMNQLNAMKGTTDLPNVSAIEVNDDFTEFNLTTTSTELSDEESISALYPYVIGKMYNIVNLTETNVVTVNFKNATTGEVIYTSDAAELDTLINSEQ